MPILPANMLLPLKKVFIEFPEMQQTIFIIIPLSVNFGLIDLQKGITSLKDFNNLNFVAHSWRIWNGAYCATNIAHYNFVAESWHS
ncbi:hypothetical protein ACFSJW_07540 [Flavobacterium artemisiae]|uniref:Uncharacterized protein n=1 Tax=Flavobacterium artemisiae TaxID=2126556 RepID=A0ABW4HBQ1_9FLAO